MGYERKKRPEKFPTEQGRKSCWRCHDKYARYNEYVVIWDEFHYFFFMLHTCHVAIHLVNVNIYSRKNVVILDGNCEISKTFSYVFSGVV